MRSKQKKTNSDSSNLSYIMAAAADDMSSSNMILSQVLQTRKAVRCIWEELRAQHFIRSSPLESSICKLVPASPSSHNFEVSSDMVQDKVRQNRVICYIRLFRSKKLVVGGLYSLLRLRFSLLSLVG